MSYTIKVTLKGRKPANRRTIQAPETATFAQLATTICALYGLDGEHLYEFVEKGKLVINHPDIDVEALQALDLGNPEIKELVGDAQQLSARSAKLQDIFGTHDKLLFYYDFSSPRTFSLEKTNSPQPSPETNAIVVLDGAGTYLVEDAGGPEGLQQFLADFKKRKRDEDRRENRAEFEEWIQPALTQFDMEKH